ncbi:MAG TPA: FmdE family protein [Anaerolineales bacterium]|nr:FmdE family protein [Anaerolineales bacterium]
MSDLNLLYTEVSHMHDHLCPRQVLGVRMGVRAGTELGIDLPQADKRLIALVETDGCTADGIGVATGCWVGRRTMFIVDYGKVAVTFVDGESGRSIRILPHPAARSNTIDYAPRIQDPWQRQLVAYQVMPDDELLAVQQVRLTLDFSALISEPAKRSICYSCAEEINNGREVMLDGRTLCRYCAGEAYFVPLDSPGQAALPPAIGPGLPSLVAEGRL